jgi:hypothetical protein
VYALVPAIASLAVTNGPAILSTVVLGFIDDARKAMVGLARPLPLVVR